MIGRVLPIRRRLLSSLVNATKENNSISIEFSNGKSSTFPIKYLRDHCQCPKCRHPETKQRLIDTASINSNNMNVDASVSKMSFTSSKLDINWNKNFPPFKNSCNNSTFSTKWLLSRSENHDHSMSRKKLWGGVGNVLTVIPSVSYKDFMNDPNAEKEALQQLYDTGLLSVDEMPSCINVTESVAKKRFGGYVMQTIYGQMWTTRPESAEESYNDTASTNEELLPHTDCTYMREPPGLQLFNCTKASTNGGDSRYVDGFQVMSRLSKDAQSYFKETRLDFECHDEAVHLKTRASVFNATDLVFRHNDYDRADLLPERSHEFYHYHDELMSIIRDPAMEFRLPTVRGKMVITDNHRVMHGRYRFEGHERTLIGCYVTRDAYESRLRMLNIIP